MLPNVTTVLPGHQNSTANSTGVFDWEPFSYYYSPWRELQLVWVTICMTLGTCGNTAVLLTISSVEELRTPGNALLCALAVADIFQVISKCPIIIWLLMWQQPLPCENNGLLFLLYLYLTGSLFSVNIIGPISLDRYWYICYPLKYSSIMTRGRTACLVVLPLLVSITNMVLIPFFDPEGKFYFFPPYVSCRYSGPAVTGKQATNNACYGIVVLTMLFCYFKIWREVRRQQARHRQLLPQALTAVDSGQSELTGTTRQTSLSISSAGHKRGSKPGNKVGPARICEDPSRSSVDSSAETFRKKVPSGFKRRMKTVTTILLVIGVYFITWLPYFVVILRQAKWGDEASSSSDGPWQRFAMLFSLISAFSNPIIYTRNRQFRQGLLRLFRCRN
ncbi:5-hydroxytryptamine receptor 1B-like [Branchiostoma floridae x Branchiostoma belcheri]